MLDGLILRPATEADSFHVAMIIAEALGDSIMERYQAGGHRVAEADAASLDLLMQVASRPDTLYTWRHCMLAVDAKEDQVLGGLISYPGDDYLQRRALTFSLVSSLIDFDVAQMDAEVQSGEYYLDSLAVWPSARGRGVARQLMQEALCQARSMGRSAVLACSPHNPGAHRLYESLGFCDAGRLFIFGEEYIRMEVRV